MPPCITCSNCCRKVKRWRPSMCGAPRILLSLHYGRGCKPNRGSENSEAMWVLLRRQKESEVFKNRCLDIARRQFPQFRKAAN